MTERAEDLLRDAAERRSTMAPLRLSHVTASRQPRAVRVASASLSSSGLLCLQATRAYGCSRFSAISFSCHRLRTVCTIPTFSVIMLPLLCLAGVLYSIRAYNHQTDMLSLEFTSTYLIGIVTALCLSLAAVYFLGTFGDRNPTAPPSYPAGFRSLCAGRAPCAPAAVRQDCPADRNKGALLVIGSGEDAIEFYRSYRRMNERHAIRFIDPCVDSRRSISSGWSGLACCRSSLGTTNRSCRLPLRSCDPCAHVRPSSPSSSRNVLSISIFIRPPFLRWRPFLSTHWRRVYLRGVSPAMAIPGRLPSHQAFGDVAPQALDRHRRFSVGTHCLCCLCSFLLLS